LQRYKVALWPLADRSVMATQTVSHSTAAAFQQMGVQRLEVLEQRDGDEEVPTRITDEPFDFALVVVLSWSAKPVLK
jgi:vacuolar-type H+-ATPase subunit F/Vma7